MKEFRDDLGNPAGALTIGLELQLKDFATEALIENLENLTQCISISSSTLYDFIQRA
jgi:hypothetical protein